MRGHNEGSIYQRTRVRVGGEKVLVWTVAVTTPTGRRTAEAKTRAEAKLKLAELKRQRDAGQGRGATLTEYLTRWLAETRPTVRYQTARHYSLVAGHLIVGLGRYRLDELNVEHVEAYLRSLQLAPRTINHHRAVLRRALNDALRRGLLVRNVAALARPPKVETVPREILSPEQAEHLIEASADEREHALWLLAVTTGQRQGELLGLRWTSLDLDGRTLRVSEALSRRGGRFVMVAPKTAGSRHVVPVTPRAVAALREWKVRQVAEAAALGLEERGLVFTTPKGEPYHNSQVLNLWHATLERLGLPRVRFHDLRHTAASLMLAAGYTLEDVKQMLGHSTIAVTSDTYSHPMADRLRQVADGTEAFLQGSRTVSRMEPGRAQEDPPQQAV
jgi:integrase